MDIADFNLDWEEHDHQVIQQLYHLEAQKPKDLRSKTFQIDGTKITSWTMQDHLYKKSFYPTHARGLFTTCDDDGQYRIKVRGYDKFFNINETKMTQWSALEKETEGPYDITAKENGCIIFIAALSSTSIVATSKHMIPDPKDDAASHGGVGYRWLLKHLETVGRAPEDLAAWLWTYRVTMVAELCDDEFEEHVLPYRTNNNKSRGLYLHGINYNTMALHTLPMDVVHQVAQQFGLLTVASISLGNDILGVRHMADDVQKTPTGILDWMDGDESEGIVVRCRRADDNSDFFFKVKNDTYLMYREYREVTKALVEVERATTAKSTKHHHEQQDTVRIKACYRKSGRGAGKKKLKIRFEKTLYYVHWLQERVVDHPEWFLHFKNNKGIIDVRKAFEQDCQDGKVAVDLKPGDLDIVIEWDTRW
ncbi:RNA ligase-domain-containing protein [Absidia repens]|uniref:RNA ligase-domain-containing protein n=1 Tax=Absidia repens TaxID=90262 RepID=A0A1X2IWC1_9FUNG|nr:RNA ligase-domain-containing protein [Absidia repens]